MRQGAGTAERRAFSSVELLVVIGIIGILSAILAPAVQMAREAARGTTCRSRLRSLAFATLRFEQGRGCLPPARVLPAAAADVPSATWLVRVMPYLEQPAAAAWDDSKPYADQSDAARGLVVADFLCPTRREPSNAVTAATMSPDRFASCGCLIPGRPVAGGAVADFGGNHGHSPPTAPGAATAGSGLIVSAEYLPGTARWLPRVRPQDARDGLSHTLLAAEMHVPRGRLCRPPDNGPAYDATDFFSSSRVGGRGVPLGDGPDDDAAGMGLFAFGSWHPGVCHAAFGDGRIVPVSTAIAADVLSSLCDRADDSR